MSEAIIYCRFSPRPDADESESNAKQEAVCREWCAKHNMEVREVFADRALSGDDADRPGLWAAIDSLRRGDTLVVRWRNRLARDVYLSEVIKRAVDKCGARIVAAEGGNNGSNPDDVFIQQVLAAFAEREKKITAQRTKYAMLRHQKEGRRMSKIPPYGYREDLDHPGRWAPDPAQQDVIKTIIQLRKEGLGMLAIGKRLEACGVQPAHGAAWHASTIRNILIRAGVERYPLPM